MKKLISAFLAVIFISAAVVGAFIAYNFAVSKYEAVAYPRPYGDIIKLYADECGVPEYVVYAVIRSESSFDEDALSPRGAVGLMQLMPDTFTWLQTKTGESLEQSQLYSPKVNIRYGIFLLGMLFEEFGDLRTVAAAYNAGITRVRGWLSDPDVTENGRLVNIPFAETRQYVDRVSDAADVYERLYYLN